MLEGMFDKKFSELAKFNAEPDKTIFADWYIKKMEELEREYIEKFVRLAKQQGVQVM